jgi:hypothetical protein
VVQRRQRAEGARNTNASDDGYDKCARANRKVPAMQHPLAAFLLTVLLTSVAAAQESQTSLGVLTCTSVKSGTLSCGFQPSGNGVEEKYVGTVGSRDAIAPGKRVLIFAVSGPADTKFSTGMLAQRFIRASGQINQPPTLVGDKDHSIFLQFETSNGAGASAGITHIDLKLTTTPA